MNALRPATIYVVTLAVCICGCMSPPNEVVLLAAMPPEPFSLFTRFPYYTYNQTAINGNAECNGIPIDFVIVLFNHTPMPIAVPNCETLWPNAVDIDIKIRDGTIYDLKTAGVVSVRLIDEMNNLVVPPEGSIVYPVVLDPHLFQNLPWLALGDDFLVRATISWSAIGSKSSSIAVSKWIPVVYKAKTNADLLSVRHHDSAPVPPHASSLFKEDGDVEVNVNRVSDENE